jgi:hypothetical protein
VTADVGVIAGFGVGVATGTDTGVIDGAGVGCVATGAKVVAGVDTGGSGAAGPLAADPPPPPPPQALSSSADAPNASSTRIPDRSCPSCTRHLRMEVHRQIRPAREERASERRPHGRSAYEETRGASAAGFGGFSQPGFP